MSCADPVGKSRFSKHPTMGVVVNEVVANLGDVDSNTSRVKKHKVISCLSLGRQSYQVSELVGCSKYLGELRCASWPGHHHN